VTTEEHLISQFFPTDVKIADVVTRERKDERMSKVRGAKAFRGELIVLTDSQSASAAEMFARVIQIEKRGKIIGDLSAGAVMTSITIGLFPSELSAMTRVGMSVTVADVIMRDGSRLEKIGVVPDLPIIPNAEALSKKLDPVLAVAAHSFGATLTPEDAGKLNFAREKYDDEDMSESDEEN
jgi:C-terminal processing protease CtpA/Prc